MPETEKTCERFPVRDKSRRTVTLYACPTCAVAAAGILCLCKYDESPTARSPGLSNQRRCISSLLTAEDLTAEDKVRIAGKQNGIDTGGQARGKLVTHQIRVVAQLSGDQLQRFCLGLRLDTP